MVELKEEEKFVEESIVLEIYEEPETEQEVATEIESEEIVVAEEQTGTEEVSSREENSITEEESTTSNVETQEETRTENSSSQPTSTDTETTEQTIVAEDVRVDSVQVISEQIARTTLDIDQQLILTQNLVAKVMSNNDMITGYTKVNTDIFKQPNLVNINIDSYINSIYTDNRDIYPNQYYEDRLWTSRQ